MQQCTNENLLQNALDLWGNGSSFSRTAALSSKPRYQEWFQNNSEEWVKPPNDKCTKLVASSSKRLEAEFAAKAALTTFLAKVVNTYVHVIFQILIFNKCLETSKPFFHIDIIGCCV